MQPLVGFERGDDAAIEIAMPKNGNDYHEGFTAPSSIGYGDDRGFTGVASGIHFEPPRAGMNPQRWDSPARHIGGIHPVNGFKYGILLLELFGFGLPFWLPGV